MNIDADLSAMAPLVASHACHFDDLVIGLGLASADRSGLWLGPGWPGRWTVGFSAGGGTADRAVSEVSAAAVFDGPVRRFGWGRRQRHRPGLQYMVCTGRHHGFESLAEQRLLLALDFLGVDDVVSQPLELRMVTASGAVRHVPDFFVLGHGGRWLVDVRPAERVRSADREKFAGTAEVALTLGWRYMVVTGWRSHVLGTLDALSAQRRPIDDPLGLQAQLLEIVRNGPVRFADLVGVTAVPVMARAHALHLLWHRALSVDLALPLGDDSIVSPVPRSSPGRRQ